MINKGKHEVLGFVLIDFTFFNWSFWNCSWAQCEGFKPCNYTVANPLATAIYLRKLEGCVCVWIFLVVVENRISQKCRRCSPSNGGRFSWVQFGTSFLEGHYSSRVHSDIRHCINVCSTSVFVFFEKTTFLGASTRNPFLELNLPSADYSRGNRTAQFMWWVELKWEFFYFVFSQTKFCV